MQQMKWGFVLTLTAFILGSSTGGYASDSDVVAVVGSKTITVGEFNKRYEEVRRRTPLNPPERKPFLEDLVRYEVGIQEAEKRDLKNDPLIAERIREQLYVGLVEKDLAEKISGIKINEDEMKAYYKTSPEVRSSHILIEFKEGATPAEKAIAKKRAEEIYSEVKGSKRPFEDLVKLYSDDILTKKAGGDVGFQTRLSVWPSYYEASVRLRKGQISDVVETPFGFHIIKNTGEHTFADANKKQIRDAITEKKKLVIYNDYFDKLKKKYKITVNPDAIK